jgi:hypothetical protein
MQPRAAGEPIGQVGAAEPTPTKTFDLELTEAERRDVLLDSELDTVTGGSFDLGSIVGGIAKAVVPLAR